MVSADEGWFCAVPDRLLLVVFVMKLIICGDKGWWFSGAGASMSMMPTTGKSRARRILAISKAMTPPKDQPGGWGREISGIVGLDYRVVERMRRWVRS